MTVLDDIRTATRQQHADLEAGSAIMERLLNLDGRRDVLSALYWVHQEAERVLFPRLAAIGDLDYQGRLKLPSLREDLKALGVSARELPRSGPPAPVTGDTAEALGFAYVLEGATLGGRVIMKRLAAAGSPTAGTSFFDVYGNAAGARWKRFCCVLNRECSQSSEAAVRGSWAGFEFARRGLKPAS